MPEDSFPEFFVDLQLFAMRIRRRNEKSGDFECAYCGGTGREPSVKGKVTGEICQVCHGKAFNTIEKPFEDLSPCQACQHTGKASNGSVWINSPCPVCGGTGIFKRKPDTEPFWSMIHPKVTEVSKGRFETRNYADSVFAIYKEINVIVKNIVRQKAGIELDGSKLMFKAFSPQHPIIGLADTSTATGKDEQQGYMEIFAGAMSAIRNPKAHENIEITKDRAMHLLFLASLLLHKIDESHLE